MTQTATALRLVPGQPPSHARDVQTNIQSIEASVDASLALQGELIAKLVRANEQAQVPPRLSQRVLTRALEGMSLSLKQRQLFIRQHAELQQIAGAVDLEVLGWGDLGPKPPPSATLAEIESAADPIGVDA
jgi:hypothetical protein